jgi:hypothetical protein
MVPVGGVLEGDTSQAREYWFARLEECSGKECRDRGLFSGSVC